MGHNNPESANLEFKSQGMAVRGWQHGRLLKDGHHHPDHFAPRGAKKEEAFWGVILKSERPSGALFTNSGPPFFTVESRIEVLSLLGTSFH